MSGRRRGRAWKRLLLAFGPALVLLVLAALVADWRLFFAGGALGWLLAAQFIQRGRTGPQYRIAIRHLRAGELDRALDVIDDLFRAEPDDPEHLRFRAELHRLAGHLEQATRDYERLIALLPESADGYIGLAELWVQRGDYERAREYARQGAARDPRGWTPAYTLALIADRLGEAQEAITQAQAALDAGIPDRRFRLLVHLWLARGHARLDRWDEARAAVSQVRADSRAFAEWDAILASEQAGQIRAMLGADVQVARALREGAAAREVLTESRGGER
ncbi:MAG: tetratricopeptide repeat protein [Anaerolineae bacterium]|nr:tetratricopeptide repeat protein [Anaerolineae bacterium]